MSVAPYLALALLLSIRGAKGWMGPTSNATLVSSSFETGVIAPFVPCSPTGGSVNVTTGDAFTGDFKAASFGTGGGANLCLPTSTGPFFHKEAWQGFALFIPSSFPSDKRTMVAQQFCNSGCTDGQGAWCGALTIVDNNLVAQHRTSCNSTGAEITLATSLTRDVWHSVVVDVRMSNVYDGKYSVWFDGRHNYFASGINVGFDSAWESGVMSSGASLRNGQSNSDGNENTPTTLFFDNVSWYNVDGGEKDGLAVVMP